MATVDKIHSPKEDDENYALGDPIPTRFLEQATAELKNGYRIVTIFHDGKTKKIKITHPNLEQELELNELYTKDYNKLMNTDGYMTRKEIENQLIKRGVITPKDKEELEKLQDALTSCIEVYNGMVVEGKATKSMLNKKRKEYHEIRDKLIDLSRKNSEHFVNSIESICDQKQTFRKMAMCIFDEDNNPIWKNEKELMQSPDRGLITSMISECQLFWSGLSREVLQDLPSVVDEIHRGGGSLENSQEDNGASPSQ